LYFYTHRIPQQSNGREYLREQNQKFDEISIKKKIMGPPYSSKERCGMGKKNEDIV
jgi:hypothetical protein